MSEYGGREIIFDSIIEGLKVADQKTLRGWVEQNRILPEGSARPGLFKVGVQPAAVELYKAFDDPEVSSIVIVATTQMMKSEFMINAIFYTAAHAPAPILFVQPTENLAREFAKNRIETTAKAVPEVAKWLAPKRSPDSGSIFDRTFPQGSLNIVSSQQTDATISRAIKYIFADEINKFNHDITGQLRARLTTFTGGKMILASSVAPKGHCRIIPEFEHTDLRYWHNCCPRCGSYFKPEWKHVIWQEQSDYPAGSARYVCPECQHYMTEKERRKSIASGRYRAEKEFKGAAGFYVNALANTFLTLPDLVSEYVAARDKKEKDGDESAMRDFYCDRLCVNYEPVEGQPSLEMTKLLLEDYPMDGTLPEGIELITMACDVQMDRLEVETCGWGFRDVTMADGARNRLLQSWGISYEIIQGDTARPEVWNKLGAMLQGRVFSVRFRIPDRPDLNKKGGVVLWNMNAAILAVDIGFDVGPGRVTEFVRGRYLIRNPKTGAIQHIVPVKGLPKEDAQIGRLGGSQATKNELRNNMLYAGTIACKKNIYNAIRQSAAARRRGDEDSITMRFPRGDRFGYDTEDGRYFLGLRSEKQIIARDRLGYKKTQFIYESKTIRNEPLDLRVYNLAVFFMYNIKRDLSLIRAERMRNALNLVDSGQLKYLKEKDKKKVVKKKTKKKVVKKKTKKKVVKKR